MLKDARHGPRPVEHRLLELERMAFQSREIDPGHGELRLNSPKNCEQLRQRRAVRWKCLRERSFQPVWSLRDPEANSRNIDSIKSLWIEGVELHDLVELQCVQPPLHHAARPAPHQILHFGAEREPLPRERLSTTAGAIACLQHRDTAAGLRK